MPASARATAVVMPTIPPPAMSTSVLSDFPGAAAIARDPGSAPEPCKAIACRAEQPPTLTRPHKWGAGIQVKGGSNFRRPLFLTPAPSMGAGWGGGDDGARVVFAEVTSEEACPGIEQTAAGSVIPRSGLQPHRRSATCARRLARR